MQGAPQRVSTHEVRGYYLAAFAFAVGLVAGLALLVAFLAAALPLRLPAVGLLGVGALTAPALPLPLLAGKVRPEGVSFSSPPLSKSNDDCDCDCDCGSDC